MLRLDGTWVWDSWVLDDGERHHLFFLRTWVVAGDAPLGPWDVARAKPFRAAPALFAAPLVRRRNGGWVFVGFHNREAEGIFSFEIADPIPVRLDDEGDGLTVR